MKGVPPSSEVLRPSSRALSPLGRDWLVGVLHVREPSLERLTVIHGLLPGRLGERRDEMLPADPLARDLQVFSRRLDTVVERVTREKTDVCESAHGDVPVADGCVEYECAILTLDGA